MTSVKVITSKECKAFKGKEYGYIEFWNPTPDQIKNIDSYLHENNTIAWVWVYGDPMELPDYSSITSSRITQPFWLGHTKEEAYEAYTLNRKVLMGDF